MLKIHDFTDYSKFIDALLEERRLKKINLAKAAGVSASLLSQILSGQKDFTFEQGAKATEFLQLTDRQTDYFLKLLELRRASHQKLKSILQRQLEDMKQAFMQVGSQLNTRKELTDDDRAIFYSDWSYSAVRMLSSLPSMQSDLDIQKALGLNAQRFHDVAQFLLSKELCLREQGRLVMGPAITYVPASSPHVGKHHRNWRLKSLAKSENLSSEELMITSPLSCSRKDMELIRSEILNLFHRVREIIEPSSSEIALNLNIDLLKIT